ncbi:MAG TPA: tyrosine-type recombinase/integrase [Candidatus Limiplasma sp.]|nr:tyrosine-type recombinase/integrase [Candidatus Limiplasma sp.]
MLCRKCQKEIPDGAAFCCWCGIKQVASRAPKKRGNGSGTAYKRGTTWTALVTIGHCVAGGRDKIIRRTKGGFATKSAALAYCAQLADQKRTVRCPSLDEYWQLYYGGEMEKLSESKRTSYKIAYNKLGDLRHQPVNAITISQLQQVCRTSCPTYYPARDFKSLITHLYRLAAVDGNANAQLPMLIDLPALAEEEASPFREAEQAAIWRAYEDGDRNAAIPLIMIYTGMMPGEMRKLTTAMINLDKRVIIGVGLKTKTRRQSSVILPDVILPVLEDIMQNVDGLIYPITEQAFYNRYYAALKTAGITRHLTPYSCRHTTATALAIDNSVAPQTIMRLMRWGSTRMADRYIHPDDDAARAAANTLQKPL